MSVFRLKEGCGSHTYRGLNGTKRHMVPGDEVVCHPKDLGGALNKFEDLGPAAAGQVTILSNGVPVGSLDPHSPDDCGLAQRPSEPGLQIVSRGSGWYDVVNPATGEPINDAALRRNAAYELAGLDPNQADPGGSPE